VSAPALRREAGREPLARALVALVLVILFAGFAQNFYLRAWLGSRPLTPLAYLHGAAMTAWVLLFLLQMGLIAGGRPALHRRLGRYGAALALALVVLGVVTIAAAEQRHHETGSVGRSLAVFVAYDGLSILLFGTLAGWAIAARNRPASHRRLMLMAMVALLPPAFGRLLAHGMPDHVEIAVLAAMTGIVAACLLLDRRRTGRVQRVLWVAGAAVVAVNVATCLAQLLT